MNDNKATFGSKELTEYLKSFLLSQGSLINGVLHQELDDRSTHIKVVLGSCCQTAVAIAHLSEDSSRLYADMIVLSRGFIEKIINFCYLLVSDDSEFDRFTKHTIQKSYRKLDRSIDINGVRLGFRYGGKIDLDGNPLLRQAVDEFTSPSGKEKTHWTKTSLEGRLKLISEKTKLNMGIFMLNTLSIYEDASESLHGTLYGCSYHTWAYEPNVDHKNPEEIEKNTQKRASLLFLQLGSLFHEIIVLLAGNNNINEILKASEENQRNAIELLKSALGNRHT